jgi:hypothetical protein
MKMRFWRSQGHRGLKRRKDGTARRPGYVIGVFVARQPPSLGNNLFIQHGHTLFLADPRQTRPAVGLETWHPSAEDIEALKKSEAVLKKEQWEDA